jgi:threonylcarbamoyladenosine tRNA methylthiotransferase MtaB
MGRVWYTAGRYRERLEKLASLVPHLGIGADIIVGFPGETDDDFAATWSLVDDLPFTYIHVFPYSPRSVAASIKLGPPVHPEVTKRRSADLRRLVAEKKTAYLAERDGSIGDVVLLRRSHGRYEGLTEDYLTVFTSSDTMPPARYEAKLRCLDGTIWAEPKIC